MDRFVSRALYSLFAIAIVLAVKITFFPARIGNAVAGRGERDTTGCHAWTLDGKTDFTASLEPWPVKAGEETHLVVWYAQDPSTCRIVPKGGSPGEWVTLTKEKVDEKLEDNEPGFLHKAKVKLPAGECSIELRARDSSGVTHDLTGWNVTSK